MISIIAWNRARAPFISRFDCGMRPEVQHLTDSGQDQGFVFSCLYSIVQGFLEKHGFLSRTRLSMDRARILPAKADVPRKRRRADSIDDSGFMEGDVFSQPSSSNHPISIHRPASALSELVVSVVSRRFSTSPRRSYFSCHSPIGW